MVALGFITKNRIWRGRGYAQRIDENRENQLPAKKKTAKSDHHR